MIAGADNSAINKKARNQIRLFLLCRGYAVSAFNYYYPFLPLRCFYVPLIGGSLGYLVDVRVDGLCRYVLLVMNDIRPEPTD
ncbi:hypothetical protein BDW42DRAFT_39168 [Aspergillus taichungensis]|uniref:Uncharacterized protein n=1 Tax=Aspergillus taichungensis TaxID=482145 RepID=A0A2J5HEU1_9EURO|nr:hypothetical protein BDW42DRAFT_39168 [Aspergillus taichungensis]